MGYLFSKVLLCATWIRWCVYSWVQNMYNIRYLTSIFLWTVCEIVAITVTAAANTQSLRASFARFGVSAIVEIEAIADWPA